MSGDPSKIIFLGGRVFETHAFDRGNWLSRRHAILDGGP